MLPFLLRQKKAIGKMKGGQVGKKNEKTYSKIRQKKRPLI